MIEHKNGDILIALSQPVSCEITQGFRALVNIRNKKWVEIVGSAPETGMVSIRVAGLLEPSPYEGFQFISILDDDDKVLSLNQTSQKSKGITAVIKKNLVQRGGLFVFKILLTASSTNEIPKPGTIYSKTSSALRVQPSMAPREPADGPHTNPIPQAVDNQALETNIPIADIDTIEQCTPGLASSLPGPEFSSASEIRRQKATVSADGEGQERIVALIGRHKPRSNLALQVLTNAVPSITPPQIESWNAASWPAYTEDASFLSNNPVFVPLSNTIFQDSPHDVHFYHYDQAQGVHNLIKAHHTNLEEYPTLSLYVEKSRAARNEFVSRMKPTMNEKSSFSLRAPVMVDISCFSFPAFKILTEYMYTRDINGIISKISAVRPMSCLPSSNTLYAEQTATAIDCGLALHLDELLHVAHVFEIHELFDICVERLIAALTVDNVLHILLHLGEQFEEIKQSATIYISQHRDQIFRKGATESELNEKMYKHPQAL